MKKKVSEDTSSKVMNKKIGYTALSGGNKVTGGKSKEIQETIGKGASLFSMPTLNVSFSTKSAKDKEKNKAENYKVTQVRKGEAFKRQLTDIYQIFNPDRIDTIDKIIEAFKGREDILLKELGIKYGFEVDLDSESKEAKGKDAPHKQQSKSRNTDNKQEKSSFTPPPPQEGAKNRNTEKQHNSKNKMSISKRGSVEEIADVVSTKYYTVAPGGNGRVDHGKDPAGAASHETHVGDISEEALTVTEVKKGSAFVKQLRAIYKVYNPTREVMCERLAGKFMHRERFS